MKSKRLYVAALILFMAGAASSQTIQLLWTQRKAPWPVPVPAGLDTTKVLTDTTKNPYLTIYLPASNANGAAVVICPGGGYSHLSPIREGRNVAIKFNGYGVAGFVLRYRYGVVAGNAPYMHPIEMWDGQRAVRWVRANAAKYGIDPKRVGIMGFSAGGHLASTVATHYDAGNPDNTSIDYYPGTKDSIDAVSCKPDFQILGYPVINMDATFAHAGSVTSLLGTAPSAALKTLMSNEKQITTSTTPAFVFQTLNDSTVPVRNSQVYSDSLQKKGVAHKYITYPSGTHGFGLADGQDGAPLYSTPPNDIIHWPDSARAWMQTMGYMTATTGILPHERNGIVPMSNAISNPELMDVLGRASGLPDGRPLKIAPASIHLK